MAEEIDELGWAPLERRSVKPSPWRRLRGRWRTRWRPSCRHVRSPVIGGHVVVCGLGARGLALARSFNARGQRVVAIESDDGAHGIRECREEGIVVLMGDATDRAMLRRARAGRARYLIAVGPDDSVNTAVAAELPALVRRRRRGVLTAFVHVTDPNLRGLLGRASSAAGSYRLEPFSVYERAAPALVSEHLPAFREGEPAEAGRGMVVVGLGALAEALLVHAAKVCRALHGESGERLAVTIVDRAATRKCELLRLRHPQLDAVCDLTAREVDIEDPEFSRGRFLFDDRGRPVASVVYVCVDDDALGLAAAQALLPKVRERELPIAVRIGGHGGLARLLEEARDDGESLRAFPLLERTCTPELLLDGPYEVLARLIHDESARGLREMGETPESEPYASDWDDLSERLREASRDRADLIRIRLRLLGLGVEPLTDWDAVLVELSPQEVNALAAMEFERRMQYPEPWDALGAEEPAKDLRESDRRTARRLPAFLAGAGFRVYRLRR